MSEADKSDGKPKRARWRWLSKVLIPAATGLIGILGGYLFNQYGNRLRHLPYYLTSSANLIPRIDLGGRSLKISLTDPTTKPATTQPLDNISTVGITIFNDTGVDFVDVPIIVRFEPTSGQQPKLIRSRPTSPPEIVKESPAEDLKDGSLRLRYDFKKINRGDLVEFVFVFENGNPPESSVTSIAKGVEMERRTVAKEPSGWGPYLGGMFAGIIGAVVLGFWERRKAESRVVSDIVKIFVKNQQDQVENDRTD